MHTDEQGMKAGRQEEFVKHRQNVRVLVSIICLIKSLYIYWKKKLREYKEYTVNISRVSPGIHTCDSKIWETEATGMTGMTAW